MQPQIPSPRNREDGECDTNVVIDNASTGFGRLPVPESSSQSSFLARGWMWTQFRPFYDDLHHLDS